MNNITMALVYSPTTELYFEQNELERVLSMNELLMVFSNTMLLEEDIVGIYLYDKNLTQIAATGKKISKEYLTEEIVKEMKFSNLFCPEGEDYYYTISSPVYDLDSHSYGKQIGMSVFLMKVDGMKEVLENSEATDNSQIYLLDENGRVVASSEGTKWIILDESMKQNSPTFFVQSYGVKLENWQIVSRTPHNELYNSTSTGKSAIVLAYILACLLVCVFAYFCYKNFVQRISVVDHFIRGVLNNPYERLIDKRNDEISRVARSLNQMLDDKERREQEIQAAQKRMFEIELAREQIQLLAYRNQINPHFLYNTFECIRAMALYHDVEDIAEITMALSKVFRFAIKGENIVTVQQEIEYIKEYATIIEYRFMGKIEVDVEVEEELLEKNVVKLILQPLVENAVFHGLEQKMGGGEVNVTIARKWDSHMMFLVEDNGCGMEPQQVQEIIDSLGKKENQKGIGLSNIYQRLKLFYGKDIVFEVKSRVGEGTRVMIVLPEHVEER